IWIVLASPPVNPATPDAKPAISRMRPTEEKKRLNRLIVAFVVAMKHYLRAEGRVHHQDLEGELGQARSRNQTSSIPAQPPKMDLTNPPLTPSLSVHPASSETDAEAHLGLCPTSPTHLSQFPSQSNGFKNAFSRLRERAPLKRRPTAVCVSEDRYDHKSQRERSSPRIIRPSANERTPLIKAGVKLDTRWTGDEAKAEVGLGRMVELGLPLIIRTIFRFRRMGCLEAVGPAGMNAMQALVQSMTDQLGAMERIVQTPIPVIFGVHLKQTVTLFLFILPFTLVDLMGWKMVFIVTCGAFTMMGVEHIAAQVEMPFGTDACDLNLDLYCNELLYECEAILERLPEGDEDDFEPFTRSERQREVDHAADDDGADDGDAD
ncbi:Bestrophin, RFP-TM, chloride channel-domain-containing protein, partial [Dioszegia hungarica]